MLRCRDVTEKASDLLEGDLSLGGRLAMRFHLVICGMCRAYVDQLRKTRGLLGRGRMTPLARAEEDALIARMTGQTGREG